MQIPIITKVWNDCLGPRKSRFAQAIETGTNMGVPHAMFLMHFSGFFTISHYHGNLTSNHTKETPQIFSPE